MFFTAADYAELLGLYLGDGCIVRADRTERLRLSLDARHREIVDDAEALLRRSFLQNRVTRLRADGGSTVVLSVYNSHLSCLFPQHAPGKKHVREIALEPCQTELVAAATWSFLRGCIRSDGSVYINRTGRYEYLSYEFTNLPREIRELFVQACARVGVVCRPAGRSVRIYRRPSVALRLANVGLKR